MGIVCIHNLSYISYARSANPFAPVISYNRSSKSGRISQRSAHAPRSVLSIPNAS